MASIVFQTNKDTGITYAYESISYWDKEKQQSRAMRKLIGKKYNVDPDYPCLNRNDVLPW